MSKDNGGGFSSGLILGAIIGAVAGILMAPKPGSETRSELMEKSDYWREKAEQLSDLVVARLGPTLEAVRENVPPTLENMKSRVDPLIEQVNSRFINPEPHLPNESESNNSTNIENSEKST